MGWDGMKSVSVLDTLGCCCVLCFLRSNACPYLIFCSDDTTTIGRDGRKDVMRTTQVYAGRTPIGKEDIQTLLTKCRVIC